MTSAGDVEPPAGLAEIEAHLLASRSPDVVLVGGDMMREFLRYVRRLERPAGQLLVACAHPDGRG